MTDKRFKAVLFDKDGVLIDSIDCCLRAINETMDHYDGKEVGKEEFRRIWWGVRADVNIARRFEGATKDKIDEMYDYYNRKKLDFKELIKIYPSTTPVLEALKGKYKLGVVTSSMKEVSTQLLKDFGILKYFEVVIGGKDAKPKPAPDPLLKACEGLGVSPEESLFVGDTIADIEAGKAAGCNVVLVMTSLTKEEIQDIKDVMIVDDLKDILKIL